MSSRIQQWLQAENVELKTYDERIEALPEESSTTDYNAKVVEPWLQENRWENELRKSLGVPPDWATDEEKIEFHRRQLALLQKANQAPRCGHVYSDGTRCRAPKLRQDKVCYAHARMLAVRPRRLNLPPLEDANAVMLWLMEVSRALLEGEITERTAGLLFYGLQMAMVTARWTTFAQTKPEEMVRSIPRATRRTLTAKVAKPPHQAKTGLVGGPGDAKGIRPDLTAESAEGAEKGFQKSGRARIRSLETVGDASEPSSQAGAPAGDRRDRRNRASSPKSGDETALESTVGAQPRAAVPHELGGESASAGDPGHPPHEAKNRLRGDPGDESAKSLSTGDELGGGGCRDSRASDREIRHDLEIV